VKIGVSNLHVTPSSFWILYKTWLKQHHTFSYGRKWDENYAGTLETYEVFKANITLVISIWTDVICTKHILYISRFVDGASRYIRVTKTNLMHYLSSVHFVNQPLHVSGIFAAHHQEVYCIYATIGTFCASQLTVCWPANRQSTERHKTYQLLHIYSIPPHDGLQICPKHVEVDWRNELRINNASGWFSLHGYSLHFVSSLTCFGIPRVPSSGSLCSCCHNCRMVRCATGEWIHSYALGDVGVLHYGAHNLQPCWFHEEELRQSPSHTGKENCCSERTAWTDCSTRRFAVQETVHRSHDPSYKSIVSIRSGTN